MIQRQINLSLAAAVIVAACVLRAEAARLYVFGTDNATVTLDGDQVGRLPLEGPLDLESGLHLVRVSHAGYRSYETAVEILSPDSEQSVEVWLLPLERRVAVVSSLFLAGTGQLYLGREKTGWTFLALQLAAVSWAVYAENEFQAASTDFERAQREYQESVTDEEIRAARANMDAAWADVNDAEDPRTLALWSIVGVAVVSAAEAWWSYGSLVQPEFGAVVEPGGERFWQLGLRGEF